MRKNSSIDYLVYKLFSIVCFIVRLYLCGKTIEKIPIIYDIDNSYIFDIISLYVILMIICRSITCLFYDKRYDKPLNGSIIYFITYIIVLIIMILILILLTSIGLLPIKI